MWRFAMNSPADRFYAPLFAERLKSGGLVPSLVCFTGIAAFHIALFSTFDFFTEAAPPEAAATELLLTLNFAEQTAATPFAALPEMIPAVAREDRYTPLPDPFVEEAEVPVEALTEDPLPADFTAVEAAVTEAPAQPGGSVPAAGATGTQAARKLGMTDAEYLALVMALLEKNKIYPLAARKRGIEGDIRAVFTIRRDGSVSDMRLADKDGHRFLAQAAFETIRSASPFPVREGWDGDYTIQVNIRYQLEDAGGL